MLYTKISRWFSVAHLNNNECVCQNSEWQVGQYCLANEIGYSHLSLKKGGHIESCVDFTMNIPTHCKEKVL